MGLKILKGRIRKVKNEFQKKYVIGGCKDVRLNNIDGCEYNP